MKQGILSQVKSSTED